MGLGAGRPLGEHEVETKFPEAQLSILPTPHGPDLGAPATAQTGRFEWDAGNRSGPRTGPLRPPRGTWYAPNPNPEGDLSGLREEHGMQAACADLDHTSPGECLDRLGRLHFFAVPKTALPF